MLVLEGLLPWGDGLEVEIMVWESHQTTRSFQMVLDHGTWDGPLSGPFAIVPSLLWRVCHLSSGTDEPGGILRQSQCVGF